MPIGIYKIKSGCGDQDTVLVKYDHGVSMEIPASQYVAQGHRPHIDTLPVRSPSQSQSSSPKVSDPDAPRA